jgi:hypothetical protein
MSKRAECTPSSFQGSVWRSPAVGAKEALALEAQPERRGDDRLPHHRQVMQRVVEAEREAHHQQRHADLHALQVGLQVAGVEGPVDGIRRQGRAVELDHGHVDLALRVAPLAPQAAAVAVQRDRPAQRPGEALRIGVQLDLDAVGQVAGRFVDQHMAAGDEEQALAAREEEAARMRQRAAAEEGRHLRGGEEHGLDHPGALCTRRNRTAYDAPVDLPETAS